MKVSNMTSSKGDPVPNQLIIDDGDFEYFQSYNSMIARKDWTFRKGSKQACTIELDERYWDYSRTTSKYRNQFTGLTTAETKAGIKDGSIILVDLNG